MHQCGHEGVADLLSDTADDADDAPVNDNNDADMTSADNMTDMTKFQTSSKLNVL